MVNELLEQLVCIRDGVDLDFITVATNSACDIFVMLIKWQTGWDIESKYAVI